MSVGGWAALVLATVGLYWLEAMYGRRRLRRHVANQGWVLKSARWRPLIPFRQARFRVKINQEGHAIVGTARVGGYWTGPVFSDRIEVEWEGA